MPASCRFAMAIHILAVLAHARDGGVTSQTIAASVNTNPVVIRRLLCALRAAGIIETQKGAGLGSRLARGAGRITLAEIYRAVEKLETFSLPPAEPNRHCPVGANLQAALENVFNSAQSALERELEKKTLAYILRSVRRGPRKILKSKK